ncbi:hypothetical protein M9Y10_030137 [Tritrichomonas musculus]|uniref:Uncharacterized protein n=1 Tax=Tritrichomonas musculus TaxID=1915356 RepID=A0ABR2KPB7_9EUKA
MMLCFFILLLLGSSADEIKVPKFAYVAIVPKEEAEFCEDVGWDEIINYCDSNPEEEGGPEHCKAVMNAYKGYKCIASDETDTISTTLSQIDKSVEFLFLTNGISQNTKIDFSYLPSKMIVMLENEQFGEDRSKSRFLSIIKKLSQTKFDGTQQGIINFAKKMKRGTNNKKAHYLEEEGEITNKVKLVGNVKDKVSFLIISSIEIDIVESDLNIHTLFMYGGTISPSTQFKVRTTYFITYYGFNEDILGQLKDHSFIKSKYYQLSELSEKITINFEKDSLNVNMDGEEGPELVATVPYDLFEDSAGILVYYGDVVLNAGKESVVPDNFNITFSTNFIPMGPLGTFDYESLVPDGGKSAKNRKIPKIEKNKVTITKSGDYWNENKKPKLVINCDSKRYDIDTKDIDNFAEISRNPMYSFGDKVGGDEENSGNENNENKNDKPKDDKKKLSTGAIIGIVVGCVAFVAIVIVVVVVVVIKKKKVGGSSP